MQYVAISGAAPVGGCVEVGVNARIVHRYGRRSSRVSLDQRLESLVGRQRMGFPGHAGCKQDRMTAATGTDGDNDT